MKLNCLIKKLMVVCMIFVVMFSVSAMAGESKTASGTTNAAVVFGPSSAPLTITSIYTTTDLLTSTLKVFSWNQVKASSPSNVVADIVTNVVLLSNPSFAYTNGDTVVYTHDDGTLDYRVVSTATTSNLTLSANLSQVGSTADRIYEIALSFQPGFDATGADVGTNKFGTFESAPIFTAIGPIRVEQTGTSNAVVNATVK